MRHVGYGDRFWNGSAAVKIRDFFGYVRHNKINVDPGLGPIYAIKIVRYIYSIFRLINRYTEYNRTLDY